MEDDGDAGKMVHRQAHVDLFRFPLAAELGSFRDPILDNEKLFKF